MKLKTIVEMLGFKMKPRRYGYSIKEFDLLDVGVVRYAQWNHPSESQKSVTADAVAQYRRFIRPGDFCIDIGAHTGDSTLPIALAAGPSGLTLALEPNPYVFPVLQKNALMNGSKAHIVPLMVAAGTSDSMMEFEYSDPGFCNGGRHEGISIWRHGHTYTLPVQAIDLARELREEFAEWLPRLRFIKIDVEGYDLAALKSLSAIIEVHRPFIKVEVYKKSSRAYRESLLEFLTSRKYVVHRIIKEPCTVGELLVPAVLENWTHYDVLCTPQ